MSLPDCYSKRASSPGSNSQLTRTYQLTRADCLVHAPFNFAQLLAPRYPESWLPS
ncbi:hypothetical protein [Hymenobacter rigui]|uniref:hypothetical protein n=1 Tax=Hymenobacter rigui TaxID=334424 RepID=UPI0014770313|nr:hypothetical protein [Hymenobacter rigui]